jgi:hypothetical protein
MAYNRYLLLLLLLTLFNSTLGHQYILEFTSAKETNLFLTNYKHAITKIRYLYDSDILTGTAIDFQTQKVAKQIIDDDPSIVNFWPIHHRIRQQAPAVDFKNSESSSIPFVPQNKVHAKKNIFTKSLKILIFFFFLGYAENFDTRE